VAGAGVGPPERRREPLFLRKEPMRAAVLHRFNQPMVVESVELAPPREGEVRVKVAACGLCHTDLSIQRGLIPLPPPRILGHEGAGIVEEVGPGVTTLGSGDRVVLSFIYPCGRCPECGRGRPAHCQVARTAMVSGRGADGRTRFTLQGEDLPHWVGAFAGSTVVPENACVKIRPDVPLDRACLVGCGVTTGIGAVLNTAKVEAGATVAVFGAGGVGLNVIQAAVLAGASRIIAVDRVPAKLDLACEFGASDTIDASQHDPGTAIRDLTGGRGVDYAFEVVGDAKVIEQAFASLALGGTCCVVGVPAFGSTVTLPAELFGMEERALIGTFYGSARPHYDIPRILDLYMAGRLKLDQLVTRTFPLTGINLAFEALAQGSVARAVIVH